MGVRMAMMVPPTSGNVTHCWDACASYLERISSLMSSLVLYLVDRSYY